MTKRANTTRIVLATRRRVVASEAPQQEIHALTHVRRVVTNTLQSTAAQDDNTAPRSCEPTYMFWN